MAKKQYDFRIKSKYLAHALNFITGQQFYVFDDDDGTKSYVFERTELINEVYSTLSRLHYEKNIRYK